MPHIHMCITVAVWQFLPSGSCGGNCMVGRVMWADRASRMWHFELSAAAANVLRRRRGASEGRPSIGLCQASAYVCTRWPIIYQHARSPRVVYGHAERRRGTDGRAASEHSCWGDGGSVIWRCLVADGSAQPLTTATMSTTPTPIRVAVRVRPLAPS